MKKNWWSSWKRHSAMKSTTSMGTPTDRYTVRPVYERHLKIYINYIIDERKEKKDIWKQWIKEIFKKYNTNTQHN